MPHSSKSPGGPPPPPSSPTPPTTTSRAATAPSCAKQQLLFPLPPLYIAQTHYICQFIHFIHIVPSCAPHVSFALCPKCCCFFSACSCPCPCPCSSPSSTSSSHSSFVFALQFPCANFGHLFVVFALALFACLPVCVSFVCLSCSLTRTLAHSPYPSLPSSLAVSLWLYVCLALETKATSRLIAALSNCRF